VSRPSDWPAADRLLDVTGLACPLPILKAKRSLREVPPGSLLEVLLTDELSYGDFDTFCRIEGCTLVAKAACRGRFRVLMRTPDGTMPRADGR
jgi:tRNA 2-thiouridine synthesizing protein A